jgi:coenzyme F420-reducing hydrogenase delta subunit
MGVTTAIVGAAAGIGGLLIGGGSVATYNYINKKREEKKRFEYFNYLQDLRLRNRRVNARIYSNYN